MFSIKRFDASAESSNSSVSNTAKLDALNERILKKRKLLTDAPPPTTSQTPIAPPRLAPSLNIHPSRLKAAPLLQQSVKKAQAGLPKEKTKAKARYLKAKKDRRKARIKSTPKGGRKDIVSAKVDEVPATLPEEQSLDKLIAQRQADAAAKADDTSDGSDSDADSGSDSSEDSSIAPVNIDKTEDVEAASQAEIVAMEEDAEARNETEIKGLRMFPAAGVKRAVDPKLVRSLGLPEGLSSRTVVDPVLSRPIHQEAKAEISAQGDNAEPATRDDFAKVNISDGVRQRLESLGVTEWFAVQVSVIPYLLSDPCSRMLYRPFNPPRDLCVSAPTGSGKTLAYTVPIVEILRTRLITRLRALIVLPTRDLVSQVRSTLEAIAKGSGLRIATATGSHSFAHEQTQIVGDDRTAPQVDILIATPGRLIDHLDSTPGFTLEHLRFLVIDEADRLLNQSFQQWLRRVLTAVEIKSTGQEGAENLRRLAGEEPESSVQKLLFSATLTRDPAKIAALGLRHPHYITIQDKDTETGLVNHEHFALPHTLHEHMLITTSEEKPLHLLHLLHRAESPLRQALCFTKSVDSAARLVKLVELFEDVRTSKADADNMTRLNVQNYSSELRASDRQRILSQFAKGAIDILVCSDLISRGIDLPTVRHVVSYDAPVDAAKYVHRVGRTARAGKEGDAWTLVEEQEARHFKKMARSINRPTALAKVKLSKTELEELREDYKEALMRLARFYRKNSHNVDEDE